MRVLYVAMTRAKEKLILTGVCKDARTKLEILSTREKTAFLPYEVLSANSYLDWLLPAASPAESSIGITVVDSLGAAQMEGAWEAADELTRNVLENWDTNQIHDAGYREELKRQLDFAYPFAEEQRFQMKFTVSELKKTGLHGRGGRRGIISGTGSSASCSEIFRSGRSGIRSSQRNRVPQISGAS